MLKFICTVGMLSFVGLLIAGCASTQNSLPPSYRPQLDGRVKIEFGHWSGLPNCSMGTGSDFMWYDRRVMSEQEFCSLVSEACQSPNFRPAIHIAMDRAMDMPFHEFLERLAHLQTLCGDSIPPNTTFTLYFEMAAWR